MGVDQAMRTALTLLAEGRDLSERLAEGALETLMEGRATPPQIGAFLMGLRVKGERAQELAAMARAMRRRAALIAPRVGGILLDIVGTGGAPLKTFNASTVSAFVAAGAGVSVAKHGNRSNTGQCGSADLLEALGVDLTAPPEAGKAAIEEVGIGFLYAPVFHPAMRHAAGPRRELGIRTVFNLLGPLANPARPQAQLLGVSARGLVELFLEALQLLGMERAMVVHGHGGMDELSTLGESYIGELSDGQVRHYRLHPGALGLARAAPGQVAQLPPAQAAQVALDILKGQLKGPCYEFVLLNAGAGVYVAAKAASVEQGMELAEDSIRSGAAYAKLRALIDRTRKGWSE